MFNTYIIRSKLNFSHTYVGYSANLKQRLAYHNSSKCKHTSKFIPWELEFYASFSDKKKTEGFRNFRVFVQMIL
jgi:putative endonuclease